MTKSKIALLALALACAAAQATGTYTPPPPAPETSQASTSASSATSGSESSASTSATATSGPSSATVGNTTATGGLSTSTGGSVGNTSASSAGGVGNGGVGQGGVGIGGSARSGDSYSASQSGDVTNRTTSQYLNFPQPVWTSVPTPYGCIVSESKSGAFGWNFVSGSGSKQYSDAVCTAVRMAEAATMHCHFATSAMLNKAAFEQMYPGQSGEFFLSGNPQNLDPVACESLRRPVLRMAPVMHAPAPTVSASAAPQVNVMCSPPQARATYRVVPKKKPACVNCCK